jgi:cellulase/cellobiase CelA1
VERYKKEFIGPIAKIIKKYPDVQVVIALETDAVGNFVTNQGNSLSELLSLLSF